MRSETAMRPSRAFTLIELLVVIIVIAVMAGFAVPAYARFAARMRFDNVTRQVQDLFAYARNRAVERDTVATLAFDAQTETFVVTVAPPIPTTDLPVALASEIDNPDRQPDEPQVVHMGEDEAVSNFVVNQRSAGANSGNGGAPGSLRTIRFNPDGTCDGAELWLASRNGYTAHMILLPAVGRLILDDSIQGQP